MNIAVFCSSAVSQPENFAEAARTLGQWIGTNRHTLVYGGVNAGLMHITAQATAEAGGHIIGVVPEKFIQRADPICHEVVTATDLNQRKSVMCNLADVFVALPGGLGTVDEVISAVSQLKVDKDTGKRLLLLNLDDIFTPLITLLQSLCQGPLASVVHQKHYLSVDNTNQLITTLNQISS